MPIKYVIGIVLAGIVIIAVALWYTAPAATPPTLTTPPDAPSATQALTPSPTTFPAAVVTPLSAVRYTGTVLAGTATPLIDFNQTDFATATRANKIVVLYFFANWCPICREEFPKMQSAFNQLSTDQVVGFRVNFSDNETDDTERALAREHGVAYQHTKVIIKNGQQILKSPETWEMNRYLAEINKVISQ